jgi:hypothetical protein
MRVELRLEQLDSRRRFEAPGRERRGRGHAGGAAVIDGGVAGQDQQECEDHTATQGPRKIRPPTHQPELTRVCGVRYAGDLPASYRMPYLARMAFNRSIGIAFATPKLERTVVACSSEL